MCITATSRPLIQYLAPYTWFVWDFLLMWNQARAVATWCVSKMSEVSSVWWTLWWTIRRPSRRHLFPRCWVCRSKAAFNVSYFRGASAAESCLVQDHGHSQRDPHPVTDGCGVTKAQPTQPNSGWLWTPFWCPIGLAAPAPQLHFFLCHTCFIALDPTGIRPVGAPF